MTREVYSPGSSVMEALQRAKPLQLDAGRYRSYVESLSTRSQSLLNLHAFLNQTTKHGRHFNIRALDFWKGIERPTLRPDVYESNLLYEIGERSPNNTEMSRSNPHGNGVLLGRILFIEDLNPAIVELLGSSFGIDPLFFAMHLHTASKRRMHRQTPDEATLPSRLSTQNYINISYHRSVTCGEAPLPHTHLLRDTLIDRKLVSVGENYVGLAQHCASVIRLDSKAGFWLALILTDPAMGQKYFQGGHKWDGQFEYKQSFEPFLGPYEDFMDPPPLHSDSLSPEKSSSAGMAEDIAYYWARENPACFDPTNPTLQSLAYYPLRIVAAEWVKYVAVMGDCLRRIEYHNANLPDLEKLNKDLRDLTSWRHRSLLSQRKVQTILRRLNPDNTHDQQGHDCIESLMEDYRYIDRSIADNGTRLASMIPVMTSFVEIVDARRSLAETLNISRLTALALLFIPLSYVSSLFSMNPTHGPGGKYFWVYFAVAAPLTILVIMIAKPPHMITKPFRAWRERRRLQRSTITPTDFGLASERVSESASVAPKLL